MEWLTHPCTNLYPGGITPTTQTQWLQEDPEHCLPRPRSRCSLLFEAQTPEQSSISRLGYHLSLLVFSKRFYVVFYINCCLNWSKGENESCATTRTSLSTEKNGSVICSRAFCTIEQYLVANCFRVQLRTHKLVTCRSFFSLG